MKKTPLILAAIAAVLVTNPTFAQEVESLPSPVPSGVRMRLQEMKENREQFREDAKEMRETNMEKKKQLREEIKEGRNEMREENKEEREAFREEWKNMTPEERLTAVPSRKAMVKENIQQRKSFFETTKTRWTDLGTSIRSGWKDLMSKWFGSK